MKKFITFIIIIIFINIIFPTKVWAQESLSLSLYPPIIEVITKPDQTITQAYKIGNGSNKDVELVTQIVPFKPAGENGSVQLAPEKISPDRAINWFSWNYPNVSLDQPFVLKAGAEQEVDLLITIPQGAAYKDYYYALLVKSNPQVSTQGPTRTLVSGVIGSLLLLSVADNNRQPSELEISEFGLGKYFLPNIVDSFDNVSFDVFIKNMGKYYAKTEGKIIVTGVFGQVNTKVDLLPVNVLAFSSRKAICVDSPDCRLPADMAGLPRRPLMGRFQAKLTLDTPGQKREQSFYFYVLPVKMGGFILAVIILGTGLRKMIKFVIKRDIRR